MWLWWVGNALLLLVVIPVVVFLATKIISHVLEIRRYAHDILEYGANIDANLEPVPALNTTRDNARVVKEQAVRYLQALGL